MHKVISFVPNTPDGLHCMQSAYKMIALFFKPDFDISWTDWSNITGYEAGRGTWATAGLLWFKANGFDVTHKSLFDYEDFAAHGGDYLIREYGSGVGTWQVEHSNIPLEQDRAQKLLVSGICERVEPTQDDIKSYLDNGYLVRCLINSNKLNNKPGYFGHAIVVSGYDDSCFIIQDPGLPPLQDRRVSFVDFESAWAEPNKEAKELDAIKLL